MAENFGRQTASGHLTVAAESKEPYADDVLASLRADAELVIARYPRKGSALLPILHLVQSVDGYVTGRGIDLCAELLDLSTAEVSGVATFYSQYKRHPNGEYTVGVCTNTLCAIMGGDRIWDEVSDHLGVGHDETTADGRVTLERIECNAACDYAPVVMANWEFFDNQTPESAKQLVDDLRAGKDVRPTRGADKVSTFKQVSRTLAGFSDGLADQGIGAGPASIVGLRLARANGWTAPGDTPEEVRAEEAPADQAPADTADHVVPHDATADAPTEKHEQSAHETADADKPVEASEQPAPRGDDTADADKVPVEGTPAIVAEIDTEHVDQPAAEQAAVAGTPPPEPEPEAAVVAPAPVEEHSPQPTLLTEVPPSTQGPSTATATATPPAPAGDSDVDEATVARINLVARGAAAPAADEDDDEAGATVSRSELLAGAGAQQKAADRGSHDDGGHGAGSARPASDGSGPTGWDVKAKQGSMVFHTPDSPWYKRTKAEVWFRDAAAAAAAGFTDALDRRRETQSEQPEGKDDA